MTRSPPSRKQQFVNNALRIAEDPLYGYSQKPPSGRWGPDFDCSSLVYYLAKISGYDVEAGGDKVRFTGTMLKDFEKAGFQILPFANVGISDLQIGDILLNLALHAEVYVGNGESVGATSSETGEYVGEAGDQTGHEIEKHPVITFNKGWDYVLRPPKDTEDEVDENEEGGEEVPPMNYGPAVNPMPTQAWNTQQQPWGSGYSQGYQQGGRMMPGQAGSMQGYPQGNLGQMNGYSQASAGYPQNGMQGYPQSGMQGYPQGGAVEDLEFVKGIEGANALTGVPDSRKTYYDDDNMYCYIVTFGPQGRPVDIHPYRLEDCAEEMPQHLSPLMRHNMGSTENSTQTNEYITRTELEQLLKEMLPNAQSSAQTEAGASRANGPTQSANAGRTR